MSTTPPPDRSTPITANATFCATLVDTWIARGLRAAFVAPGSRSTPLALALAARDEVALHLFHDERSASFAALGHARVTGIPAVILCSSGTAGTHFHGAVVEADLSRVPLLVCTADRPPELWDRGAPQTIRQTHLYGPIVRAFVEPGCPDDGDPATWRGLANEWFDATLGTVATPGPGPVHANLSFRDPLTGVPGELPPEIQPESRAPGPEVSDTEVGDIAELFANPRGLLVVGRGPTDPELVLELATRLGWPVIADHRSGGRRPGVALRHFDAILRDEAFAAAHVPEVILRLGEIVSSKAVSQFLTRAADAGATVIAARPWDRLIDPEHSATWAPAQLGLVEKLLARLPDDQAPSVEIVDWMLADDAAATAIEAVLAAEPAPNDPQIARAALAAVPAGGALVVSSSMPVRDVEWFGQNRDDIAVHGNRGANGIDGIVATAIGTALAGLPTICLIGDVAFLHDAASLTALARRGGGSSPLDLTIVVTDNDGGGIFSFLPQHDLLPTERYEQLFGTPHGTDLAALAAAHGLAVEEWRADAEPDLTPSGVRVVLARTDRTANLALHRRLVAAVADAICAPSR